MKIISKGFKNQGPIPLKYTGEGEDVSPPFTISEVPPGTKSLAVIMDDPDAPMGTFDHWIAWDIPETLAEGQKLSYQGKNHFGTINYKGPYPPYGKPHRYFFKFYALDSVLSLQQGISKKELENAMQGHVLATAEIMGTYQRVSV